MYIGAFWILRALPKFLNPHAFLPPQGSMGARIALDVSKTSGFYHAFLANVVQPHLALWAQLDRFGEIIAGILLFLGLFTRLGGLVGVFLGLNYLLAAGYTLQEAFAGMAASAIALSAINLALPTGRVLGFDALLARRKSRDDTPPMPMPPKRSEPQPQATVASAPQPAPVPNGTGAGPAFAPPASAGPQVDQSATHSA